MQIPDPISLVYRNACLLLVVALLALGAREAAGEGDQLENQRMARLAAVQAKPESHLARFETDGCSGGLSTMWRWLAGQVPSFRRSYGDRPPWESCCVVHDRAYWRGQTKDGYIERERADVALRQCVVSTGERLSIELGQQHGISAEQVEKHFRWAADAMYYAVRAGGGPCTPFDWRWGYGWPPCPIMGR